MKEDANKFLGITDNPIKPSSSRRKRIYYILALLSPFLGFTVCLSYAYVQMAIHDSSDAWGMYRFYLGLLGAGIGVVAALIFIMLALTE